MANEAKQKKCTKCGEMRDANRGRNGFGSTPSGNLRGKCRACTRADSKSYDNKHDRSSQKRGVSNANYIHHKPMLLRRQNHKCPYCHVSLDMSCEVDHKTPVIKGGSNDSSNLQATCAQCNREKHNKTHREHLAWRELNANVL